MMERSRDFRRASVSGVNGLVRRRQRITTSFRDSTEEERQIELKETARLRDRDRLQKKDRDREFSKRRRVERSSVMHRSSGGGAAGVDSFRDNDSTDSSEGEDYFEEEGEIKAQHQHHHKGVMNQLSPPASSSVSNSRRGGLRTLRSSPVFRFPSDEILGVPVPRRTRSASARTLQKCWISSSIKFGEDLSHRSNFPATASQIGFSGDSPSSSGASMKKKMKSTEPRNRVFTSSSNSKPSAIQDDIEIEVVEALFDLMKQSQSSQIQEKSDRDSPEAVDNELQRRRRSENNAAAVAVTFPVIQKSSEADGGGGGGGETIRIPAVDSISSSMKDLKKRERRGVGGGEKEKFPDDPADKLVGGDVFVNKGTLLLGSPKEKNESPSCGVKVNACDIKDPTVTKAEHTAAAAVAKPPSMEVKLDINLMAPLSLVPEKVKDAAVVDMEFNPKASVQKKSETILPDSIRSQPQSQKEQKIQLSSPYFPFPIGMGSWSGYPSHPGCMPHLQTSLPVDASVKPSMITRSPQFKLSQPRPKRCTTHQYIAQNIDHHQQKIKKSLSDSAGSVTAYGTESLNSKSMFPAQMFASGTQPETVLSGRNKDKSLACTAAGSNPFLQQSSNQGSTKNLLHGSGYMFPLGSHHAPMMMPATSSGPPQSASAVGSATLSQNPTGKPPTNLSIPGGVSFNHHSIFPSNGTSPYMAILQNNNGGPIPITTNIPMPTFKGGSPMPLFNSSPYPSSMFNANNQQQQQQQQFSSAGTFSSSSSRKQPECQQVIGTEHKIPTSASAHPMIQPMWPPYSSGKSEPEIGGKNSTSVGDGRVKPNGLSASFPVQPMIPPLSIGGNKNSDHSQQSSKGGRVELMPPFALSFGGSNPSTNPSVASFSSMMQQNPAIFQMLPDMVTQQKNYQQSEVKFPNSGDHSFNMSKPEGTEKSASSTRTTVNYLPSGNQSSIPNFQQLHHHQQQQLAQLQHHQMKASTAGSFLATSFPNTTPQSEAAAKWMNFPRNNPSEGSVPKNAQHITFVNSSSTAIAIPPPPSNQSSSIETNQKPSTPACRINIPSILSTCPSQLPELKY